MCIRDSSVVDKRLEILMCPSSGDRDIGTFNLDGLTPPDLDQESTYVFPLKLARSHYVGNIGSLFTPVEVIAGGT